MHLNQRVVSTNITFNAPTTLKHLTLVYIDGIEVAQDFNRPI